jgi:hypothetical protein
MPTRGDPSLDHDHFRPVRPEVINVIAWQGNTAVMAPQ